MEDNGTQQQDGNATPDSGTTGGNQQQDTTTQQQQDAPFTLADFAIPEGSQVDTEVVSAFKGLAQEIQLSQDHGQKIVDKIIPLMAQRQQESWTATVNGWQESAKSDKEFGGAQYQQSIEIAQRALNTLGTPELKEALNQFGFGNHPELIRLMVRVGKAMSEQNTIVNAGSGGSPNLDNLSAVERLKAARRNE